MKPIIGITMGDPSGIGPEVILKALSRKEIYDFVSPLVIGRREAFTLAKEVTRITLGLNPIGETEEGKYQFGTIDVFEPKGVSLKEISFGKPNSQSAKAVIGCIESAVQLALEGKLHGITTAPVSKEALHGIGFRFQGHTDFLAHLTGSHEFCMLLACESLKVSLSTIHIPLRDVPQNLSKEGIVSVISLTHHFLRRLGQTNPKIAVCGLNPHSGEGGAFGTEEDSIIQPAILEAKDRKILCSGPYPSDTIFYRAVNGEFDAVVCMYHDQGLIPIKLLAFERAVNVTLGLPIIRTSPDHGTAYDIAGQNKADPSSMIEAIRLAAKMAKEEI